MSTAHSPDRARVWIVDDSKGHAAVAKLALGADYYVEVFHDGATALERLASRAPDVLVLDWEMPVVSGHDVCLFVRETRSPAELPILILTATADRSDVVRAFDVGANDFVRKPFDVAELKARVAGLERARRLHAQLDAAERTLREEAQYRERLIAALGHDLRQPLTAITATAQTMTRVDEQSLRAQRVHSAALRMGRMIDDVLDLSQSRRGGRMFLRKVPASLDVIAERVVEEMRGAHATRAITTRFATDVRGEWDVDRLSQVCSNLLDNAMKYGTEGTAVELAVTGAPDDVTMTVRNQGAPITEGSRKTLFDAFRQGNTATPGSGLGLGLFIVDQIVRTHGGSITASCDPDGTTFTVVLPRRSTAERVSASA